MLQLGQLRLPPPLDQNSVLAPVLGILLILVLLARATIGQRTSSQSEMTYVIKWGRERLRFTLPPPSTPLADIRKEIAAYTQLAPDAFKLVHAGAVMKDDSIPISVYGIRSNSTIAVIGGSAHDPTPSRPPPAPRTEASIVAQVRTELSAVQSTLAPAVESFLTSISLPSNDPNYCDPNADLTNREHIRLGELLLQSLLRLDAITTEGDWTDARAQRKTAVKEVQGLLDRLDGEWKQAKTKERA